MTTPTRPTALVTGASRGIGRGIALALAEAGYDVGVNYASSQPEALAVADACRAAGVRADAMHADVGDISDIEALFANFLGRFGHLDLLVNNAGIGLKVPFLETTEEQYDRVMDVNLRGVFFCTQAAARAMVARGQGGVIINNTSIHQEIQHPNTSVYGPAKAALEKFTRHAALELAPYGIRVNAVAPGATITQEGLEATPHWKLVRSRIPLGRHGLPEDVARAVVFLASEQASYITGASLTIDGGAVLPAGLLSAYTPGPEPCTPDGAVRKGACGGRPTTLSARHGSRAAWTPS